MTVGDRIRKVRTMRGISQVDLAKNAKISKELLWRYETNKVTNIPSNRIENIANALNVTPDVLMGWNDEWEAKLANTFYVTTLDEIKMNEIYEQEWQARKQRAHHISSTETSNKNTAIHELINELTKADLEDIKAITEMLKLLNKKGESKNA